VQVQQTVDSSLSCPCDCWTTNDSLTLFPPPSVAVFNTPPPPPPPTVYCVTLCSTLPCGGNVLPCVAHTHLQTGSVEVVDDVPVLPTELFEDLGCPWLTRDSSVPQLW
jgi:hypothetical protein